jgi:hypothetical protein
MTLTMTKKRPGMARNVFQLGTTLK